MHANYPSNSQRSILRKFRDHLMIILMLALLLAISHYQLTHKIFARKIFTLTVRVVYENRDQKKTWNLTESDRSIALFMNNSWQTVYLVGTSHSIERFDHDPDGNPIAILNIKGAIGPGESIGYNVTYCLIFKERGLPAISEGGSGSLEDISEDLKREYAGLMGIWQSNVSLLRDIATKIMGSETKVLSIVKKFVSWISENIDYYPFEIPQYPNETFSKGRGDCDDQANLLIAFCRSVGIPAYLQIGCIYIPQYSRSRSYWSGHLSIRQVRVGWHGWAMVYVPPWGWLPVDLTYVEERMLSENPLNSITFSAIIKHYTFQYMNITRTDYVAESRAAKSFLESHEFYVYEENEIAEASVEWPLPIRPILFVTANNLYVKCMSLQECKRCAS
ncbi:MAG: transglutaminase-like domain-containing protein [Candidatus Bathyarchaeia archaeon]